MVELDSPQKGKGQQADSQNSSICER